MGLVGMWRIMIELSIICEDGYVGSVNVLYEDRSSGKVASMVFQIGT